MSDTNRYSSVIPPEVAEQAKGFFRQGAEVLAPYLINLTPDERYSCPKWETSRYRL